MKATLNFRTVTPAQERIVILMRFVTLFAYDAARRTQCVDMANALAVRDPGAAALRQADKLIKQMDAAINCIPDHLWEEVKISI